MTGLILKLRPNEELMINGVVVQNGDRKTRLRVKTTGASILRLRDAMRPEEATTPARRAYYVAQLAVAGELPVPEAEVILARALDDLEAAYAGCPDAVSIEAAQAELKAGRIYGVMRRLGDIVRPGRRAIAS